MLRKIKSLWKIVFGRTVILIVLILLQAIILFGGFALIDNKVWIVNYVSGVLAAIVLIYILNARQNSSFKMMWIIMLLIMPVVGVAFYLFTRMQIGTAFISKRIEEILDEEEQYLIPQRKVMQEVFDENEQEYGFYKYMHEQAKYPVYSNSGAKYFPLGEDKIEELMYQLKKAEKFIFMEYFIVDRGVVWNRILKILAHKAREGVEVRFMYDGTCTLSLLPQNYPKRLEKLGIKCKVFSPMKPFLATHQNNRDHRKIAVIDGKVAFTGGINLADEYVNKRERFGHWKDTGIMVQGEPVKSFTLMFLQMWNINVKDKEIYEKYLQTPISLEPAMRTGGCIVPYGDSPYDNEDVGEKVYLDIVNRARRYVHIMTPYLILDDEMINAFIFAAQRGVKVKLIMPHIPDKKYAYILARTYYYELIKNGVEIYEYTPGFIHAKVFTCDDERAVVGTINLDYRSLYLHFECGVYIWKNDIINDIESDFNNTIKQSQLITLEDCKDYNIFYKAAGRVLRLIAPLM